MSAELLDLSGAAAAAAIRAGEVDARELFELYRSARTRPATVPDPGC